MQTFLQRPSQQRPAREDYGGEEFDDPEPTVDGHQIAEVHVAEMSDPKSVPRRRPTGQ